MNYQTYPPHPDLQSLVKCYWTLEVPATVAPQRQRIIPDGCLEMAFILGDDIKRYTSNDEFVIQPRAMVLGQITKPFFIEPIGYVDSFAVRFYPYGLANFLSTPLKALADQETPLTALFGEAAAETLAQRIMNSKDTDERIAVIEDFLFNKLSDQLSIDHIVKATIGAMFSTGGTMTIGELLEHDTSKRRQLERKFSSQVGISPKQLSKVIRLQSVLSMMLTQQSEHLSRIAYDSDYYDQEHFIKDFKEFTGMTPGEFFKFENEEIMLSLQLYK
ncbi:MAG: helix-turn-helix domain-containing protein [Chloroflexota bacterium]|nr:helix-turn-helix domain-containing protein [Chloroflexota bacterium]